MWKYAGEKVRDRGHVQQRGSYQVPTFLEKDFSAKAKNCKNEAKIVLKVSADPPPPEPERFFWEERSLYLTTPPFPNT